MLASRTRSELEAVAAEIAAQGGRPAKVMPIDVTDTAAVRTAMGAGSAGSTSRLLTAVGSREAVRNRLREGFHIGRVCVVADRGMISAATIAALEERKLEYILGARERSNAVVRRLVIEDTAPLTPLLVERAHGRDPALRQGGQSWCGALHPVP